MDALSTICHNFLLPIHIVHDTLTLESNASVSGRLPLLWLLLTWLTDQFLF